MSLGIDVSMHQRGLDWGALRRAGVEFAYIKIAEGIGYIDPLAEQHIAGARSAGLVVGGYTFNRPDTNTPEQDAQHFAATLRRFGIVGEGFLPPCLDMEQDANVDMTDWTRRCALSLRDEVDYNPVMIYANTSWWNTKLSGGNWLDEAMYGWVAHYGRNPGQPGWKGPRAVMHQYTSSGRLDGYGGDLDVNTCWVDLSTLTAGIGPGPAPDPGQGGGVGPMGPYPLPRDGHYFGLITGPWHSHGGADPSQGGFPGEREWVRAIQLRLCALGFARRNNGGPVTDCGAWSDGIYGEATRKAVIAWQLSRADLIETGNIWPDDWDRLFV